jgi:RNA polymerase subunit RPABC4/transcription elongation factor Spt4
MAFCNSCGAQMETGAGACPSCGKAATGAAPSATTAPPAQPKGSASALKIVLSILGCLMLVGILMIAGVAAIGFYVAKNSRVEQGPKGAKVETPFGTVEATEGDSAKIAESLGIEVYPGAKALPGGASATVGSMHTASAMFETDDPPERVAEFYHKQFPHATVTTTRDEDEKGSAHTVLAFGDREKWTTITIEGHEGGSKIAIAAVDSGKK